MAEPRRGVVLALTAALVLAGAVVGSRQVPAAAGPEGPTGTAISATPAQALSSTWTCGGATAGPGSELPGQLLLDNPGPSVVDGSVTLVTSDGHRQQFTVAVPGGGSATLAESVAGAAPGAWVAALVTLYGGLANVSQDVASHWGQTSQPCASGTSGSWYFPDGYTLRNAWEFLSLVNPYPVDAIADLSFTTNLGSESPGDFQGVVVPARGMAIIGLADHLRRRAHIAANVHVRSGRIVAFETELVTKPPKGAPLVGSGGVNPVAPQAGVTLMLGAPALQHSMWWPSGGEGPGLTESYDIYNPEGRPLAVALRLFTSRPGGGGQAVGGPQQLQVPSYGWAEVTTDGQPWAIAGTPYAAEVVSTNGEPLVAERSVVATKPSDETGLGAELGLDGAARLWALPPPPVRPEGSPVPSLSVQFYDPGRTAASVSIEMRTPKGGLAPVPGLQGVTVNAGQRAAVALPASSTGLALVVDSSVPVLVEQDTAAQRPARGVDLSPALPVFGHS